jgi:hypothetical protein
MNFQTIKTLSKKTFLVKFTENEELYIFKVYFDKIET